MTGLCLLDAVTGELQQHVDIHRLRMRTLSDEQIRTYVQREQPLDCAGGYRIESLGVALFDCVEGGDSTAIVGLPLMRLVAMLAAAGIDVLCKPGVPT